MVCFYLGVPEAQLTRLQRVQNSAARLVTRKRKFEHVYSVLVSTVLPIRARIVQDVLKNAFMEMPLLISVNLLRNISLVEIFGHNQKIFSV